MRFVFNKIQNLLFKYNRCNSAYHNQGVFSIKSITEDDFFIASYPKSGVTWLTYSLCGLIHGIDLRYISDRLVNLLLPDIHKSEVFLRVQKPVVVKSHDLPNNKMKKVIHLVRDGRDVMASYFAMQKNRGLKISISDMIIKKQGLFPCDWNAHCKAWIENPYKASILRISYENMKVNPEGTLLEIANFIGISTDHTTLKDVVFNASLENMKKRENSMGWQNGTFSSNGSFVRRGESGSYLDEIPHELIVYFENENREILEKLNYI